MNTFVKNETSKAAGKIKMLQTKNAKYESIFKEIKRKEHEKNQNADIYALTNKLEVVENEMNLSKIFGSEGGQDANNKIMNILSEKASQLHYDPDFDPHTKDTADHLQEILGTMYTMTGSTNSLLQLNKLEQSNFRLEDLEKEFMSKIKGAQFSAAKSIASILINKDKFKDMEIQTGDAPLKDEFEALQHEYTQLEKQYNVTKSSLDHIENKFKAMKKSHEEERIRWSIREKEIAKIEFRTKEYERKYKQSQAQHTTHKVKIKELGTEVDQKRVKVQDLEIELGKQKSYYESNDYIIKVPDYF